MYVQIYTYTYTHTQKFINMQYIPTKNHTSVCACGYVQFQWYDNVCNIRNSFLATSATPS